MKSWIVLIVCAVLLFVGCGRREVLVDSGTYDGSILKVNPDEKEIYVSLDEKRVLELYFSENTMVFSGAAEGSFDILQKGQSVRVEVERKDDAMVPLSVTILE